MSDTDEQRLQEFHKLAVEAKQFLEEPDEYILVDRKFYKKSQLTEGQP